MHLRNDINVMDFLEQVRKCSKSVWFETDEGDRIALKSTLSHYIFCTIAANPVLLSSGTIRFDLEEDQKLLEDYLCQ